MQVSQFGPKIGMHAFCDAVFWDCYHDLLENTVLTGSPESRGGCVLDRIL